MEQNCRIADFKRLKDINGSHTIYRNGKKVGNWQNKKSLSVCGLLAGLVGSPETQVFFWPKIGIILLVYLFFQEKMLWVLIEVSHTCNQYSKFFSMRNKKNITFRYLFEFP